MQIFTLTGERLERVYCFLHFLGQCYPNRDIWILEGAYKRLNTKGGGNYIRGYFYNNQKYEISNRLLVKSLLVKST